FWLELRRCASCTFLKNCDVGAMVDWEQLTSLHQLLDAFADGPDGGAVAVIDDGPVSSPEASSWTYAELQSRSVLAAQNLSSRLASEGEEVGVLATLMHRSARWYAVLVACMRVGMPIVLMSRDLPDKQAEDSRNAAICRELCPLAVADDDCLEALRQMEGCRDSLLASSLFVRGSSPTGSNGPLQRAVVGRSADDVLFLLYTGGTTGGKAKCACVTHRMALHEARAYGELAPAPGQRGGFRKVLQQTPVYWGASCIGQINIALALRGCVVFALIGAPPDTTKAVTLAVRQHGVEVLGSVPSFLALLEPEDCPSLTWLLSWGEALMPGTRARWASAGKSGRWVTDLLISTEYWLCLHATSGGECGDSSADGAEARSVFCAVHGAVLRVAAAASGGEADTSQGDALPGEAGRLCIRGPMVMRGYWQEAELGVGEELLTNDIVREVSPGRFIYCGRADFMAKEKGQWLDLAEVEASLNAVPGVREAAIVPDLAGRHTACVFFHDNEDGAAAAASFALRLRALRRELSRSCRQGRLLLLAKALPRIAATQKLDRKALLGAV
ncbi:unnamed protein product, partial [Polarella glacialis]